MARSTRAQPGLFNPAPPPLQLPQLLRADVVTLLRILLGEAMVSSPMVAASEVADDDQDHA